MGDLFSLALVLRFVLDWGREVAWPYIIQLQHIEDLRLDLAAAMRCHKLIQILLPSSGNHNRDTVLNKSLGNSLANARSGANDEDFLVGEGHLAVLCPLDTEN